MRRALNLCVALALLAVGAAAQNGPAAETAWSGSSDSPSPFMPSSVHQGTLWQLSASYDYTRFGLTTAKVNMNGIDTRFDRFLSDHLALEGAANSYFGQFVGDVNGRMIFYGGGARYELSTWHRWRPWFHGNAGGVYLRQSGPADNGLGLIAGGGADYSLNPHVALRVKGEYLGTHVQSVWQNSLGAGGGLVVNF
jgi:opacity protein-like surface antigen